MTCAHIGHFAYSLMDLHSAQRILRGKILNQRALPWLQKLISDDEDSIRFYFFGAEDLKRILRLRDPRTVEERIFIMH